MNKYLISLIYLTGFGPITLIKLLKLFKDPEKLWRATKFDLEKFQLSEKLIYNFLTERNKLDPDKIIQQIAKENLQVTTLFDNDYPKNLKNISAPPLVLFYQGDIKVLENKYFLAVIGSRKISAYARLIMPKLLNEVINKEVVIVSGLAWGVDQLAHQLVVDKKMPTIAVTGSGLAREYFYPKSNLRLAEKIIEHHGLIFSEFPPYTQSHPANFPRRNRIIAGLSQACLIIEGSEKSGSLITATYGLEQGKEILAVPQNINSPTAGGVNKLIANGARVISCANDILESLNIKILNQPAVNKIDLNLLSAEEKIIYKTISYTPLHIDKITENCTLDTSLAGACLLELELKGFIVNTGGQFYVKI